MTLFATHHDLTTYTLPFPITIYTKHHRTTNQFHLEYNISD